MGRKTHPEVRERSGDPPGGLVKVRRPTRRSGKGWEIHPELQEGSGDPPVAPGRVEHSKR